MTMGFEEALKILDQYDEGTPPRSTRDLGCGCEACTDHDRKTCDKSKDPASCDKRATLAITELAVSVHGRPILKGLTLTVRQNEVHVIMGPNAAGKSTLGNTLAGHPDYAITAGAITLNGENMLSLSPDERARRGIFIAFQHPAEIPGVDVRTFLYAAYKARYGKDATLSEYNDELLRAMAILRLDDAFVDRQLNVGLSGGEKKRLEMLQLLVLKPAFVIFDETDSGLDIESLKIVRNAFNTLRGPCLGVILITHNLLVARKADPDKVHVLIDGAIAQSNGAGLIDDVEKKGFAWLRGEH